MLRALSFRHPLGAASIQRMHERSRLVASRYLCVLGVREDWGLGCGARGLMGRCARLNLTPSLLSPPKHISSDWLRV